MVEGKYVVMKVSKTRMWHLRKNYTERNFFLLEKNAILYTVRKSFQ